MDTATLMWGVLFGSIGMGYAVYGRKQSALIPFVCGVILMFYTYFISSPILIVLIGIALMAIPYYIRR